MKYYNQGINTCANTDSIKCEFAEGLVTLSFSSHSHSVFSSILIFAPDLKTLIEEESVKEECYKFKNSGQCAYGENCFRSHFSKQQLQMFRDKRNHLISNDYYH